MCAQGISTPTSYSGGLWQDKTEYLVRQRDYLPSLQRDVRKYVQSCMVCQRAKTKHQPLPIPNAP